MENFLKKLLSVIKSNVKIVVSLKPILVSFLYKDVVEKALSDALDKVKLKIPGQIDDVVIDLIKKEALPIAESKIIEEANELQNKLDKLLDFSDKPEEDPAHPELPLDQA